MPRFKDQAICIRHLDWSETSQIVVLLTRGHGKVRGLAKGSRRTSPGAIARFSGGIELLTLGQVVGLTRPTTELATLTEWDLQRPYPHLRQDLEALNLALYAADLTHALLADEDPHPAAFDALAACLDALADPDGRDAVVLGFQWHVLSDCGYRPDLAHDVRRGGHLASAPTYVFDPLAGGFSTLDAVCTAHDGPGPWRVRRETIGLLRKLAADKDPAAAPVTRRRASRLLCVYARAILDRELPTMRFVLSGSA